MVSLVQRAVVAINYEVEPVDDLVLLVLQSELFANEEMPPVAQDPRVAAALSEPLIAEQQRCNDSGATLLHSTRHSGLRMAAAMEHEVTGPSRTEFHSTATEHVARTTVICRLEPGQRLRVVKYIAYGWSSQRSLPALNDQVRAALAAARYTGWTGLASEQRRYLDDSRRSGSRPSMSCRPERGPRSGASPPKASPDRDTTAIPSGTPTHSCWRCSATRCRTRPPTCCVGARRSFR
jgi:alpha,alpha-trehalose phosphorylase